jgi:hypothetical protein
MESVINLAGVAEMFVKSLFWDAVLRYTIFVQFTMSFIALIKVFGEGGFGNVTLSNIGFALLISVPLSFVTALGIVLYEKKKGGDV